MNEEYIKNALVECLDKEFKKIVFMNNNKGSDELNIAFLENLISYIYSIDIYKFFIPKYLRQIVESLCIKESLRDFFLNATDRFALKIQMDGFDYNHVMNCVSSIYNQTRIDPDNINACLLPESLMNVNLVKTKDVSNILMHNYYLMILFLSVVYFDETSIYSGIDEMMSN